MLQSTSPHFTTLHHTSPLYNNYNYNCNYNYNDYYSYSYNRNMYNYNYINYNYNYTTIKLQLQLQMVFYTTLHTTTSSSCGWCDHCNHSKKHSSNHLSAHQWIRFAIRVLQQLTAPIVSYLWNSRHPLVRYYWYTYTYTFSYVLLFIYCT